MSIFNTSQSPATNSVPEQTQYAASVIIGLVLLVCALLGCSLAVLALGRDFFTGKHPPAVFVGALVWVDFFGAFPTAVIVFQGFAKEAKWIAGSPQCTLQAFFATAFGLSSGAVVTLMSLDRVASLYKPFYYKQRATPCLTRTICVFLTILCLLISALPIVGIGRYRFNHTSKSFCHFDWSPTNLKDTIFVLVVGFCGVLLTTMMTASNVLVFISVTKIRRRLRAVLPSEINGRRRARRATFQQEERMAKFVALVSVVFLFTWLPITIRLFCNVFRAFPSIILDNFSLRLVVVNFLLDPFTYVLFRRSFKRNLRRSVTELAGVLGDISFTGKKFARRTAGGRTEVRDSAILEIGRFRDTSVIENQLQPPIQSAGSNFNIELQT